MQKQVKAGKTPAATGPEGFSEHTQTQADQKQNANPTQLNLNLELHTIIQNISLFLWEYWDRATVRSLAACPLDKNTVYVAHATNPKESKTQSLVLNHSTRPS